MQTSSYMNVDYASKMKESELVGKIQRLERDLDRGSAAAFLALEKQAMLMTPMERTQTLLESLNSMGTIKFKTIMRTGINQKQKEMAMEDLHLIKKYNAWKMQPEDQDIWDDIKQFEKDYDETDWQSCNIVLTEINNFLGTVDAATISRYELFITFNKAQLDDLMKNDKDEYNLMSKISDAMFRRDKYKYLADAHDSDVVLSDAVAFANENGLKIPVTVLFGGVTFCDPENIVDVFTSFGAVNPEREMKVPVAVKEKQEARNNEKAHVARTNEEIKNGTYKTFFLDIGSIYDDVSCCEYDSYDGPRIRQCVLRLSKGRASTLINTLIICMFFGNNFMDRYKNCIDPNSAANIIKSVSCLDLVRRKGTGQSALTPSRVASAFAPVMFVFRKYLDEKNLLPKTGCSEKVTPLLYHDLSLSSMSEYFKSKGVDTIDYLSQMAEKFRQARMKKDPKLELKPEDAILEMNKFRELSVKGFEEDIISKQLMSNDKYTLEDALKQYGFDKN